MLTPEHGLFPATVRRFHRGSRILWMIGGATSEIMMEVVARRLEL